MKIYWAGPLFTLAERNWNVEATTLLQELGYEVWLPQEKEPRDKTAYSIFKMDVEGLDWATMVVAVMDGPDPDSGTCWECGYAFAKGLPIVTVRTDFRNAGDIEDARINLMLHASATININLAFRPTIDVVMMIDKAIKNIVSGL